MSQPDPNAVEILRKVIRGELSIHPVNRTWDDAFAGDCTFEVGGWKFTFFNDCDSMDYTDSYERPDGTQWKCSTQVEGERERFHFDGDPLGPLSYEEDDAFVAILKKALPKEE